jgi:hypothetical protein
VPGLRTQALDPRRHRAPPPTAKNPKEQGLFYSGKKKAHTEKNIVVVNATSERVLFLRATYAGKVPDKRIADQEQIVYPGEAVLYKMWGSKGMSRRSRRRTRRKKRHGEENSPRMRSA